MKKSWESEREKDKYIIFSAIFNYDHSPEMASVCVFAFLINIFQQPRIGLPRLQFYVTFVCV